MAAASTDNRKVALITGVTGQVNLNYPMYLILMCLIRLRPLHHRLRPLHHHSELKVHSFEEYILL